MTSHRPEILSRIASLSLLIAMGTMWGLQFAMLKIASQSGYSDLSVLMFALTLLSVIFTSILFLRRETFRITADRLKFLLVTSLLGYVVPLSAALYAAPHIPAGILTLIASSAPIVTVTVALLLKTEYVSKGRVIAVALGLVSIILVLFPELEAPGQGRSHWMVVALIVPIAYGIESIYIFAHWPKGMSALQAVTGETVVATALVAPIFAFFGNDLQSRVSWTQAELAILIFALTGVVESLIYFYLIRMTGGVFVSFGTFVSLFAGIAWGIFLFSEEHTLIVWLAVATLVMALFLVSLDRTSPANK